MLLDTGLRASEWCAIRKEHYDEDNFCIRVKGKGDKWRTVPLSPKTVKALDAYLKKEKQYEHEALILSERGMALSYDGIYQIVKRTAKVAGVKNPGCHGFRRSFAVYMRRNKADLFAIQDILGHSDITMTRIYTQTADTDVEEKHRRCSPVMHFDF
jgi:site-specific recombinase XerD